MIFSDGKCWSKLDTTGKGPSPRDKLASSVIDGKIYLFGGFGPQGTEDEDVSEESSFTYCCSVSGLE